MPEKKGPLGWHAIAPCWFRHVSVVVSDPIVFDLPRLRACADRAVVTSDPIFGMEEPQEQQQQEGAKAGGGKEAGQGDGEESSAVAGEIKSLHVDGKEAESLAGEGTGDTDKTKDREGEGEPSLPLSVGPREAGGMEGGSSSQGEAKEVHRGLDVSVSIDDGSMPDIDGIAEDIAEQHVEKEEVKEGAKKMEPTVTDEATRRLYTYITAEVRKRLQEAVWEAHRRHDGKQSNEKTEEV